MVRIFIQIAVDGPGKTEIDFEVGEIVQARMALNNRDVTAKVDDSKLTIKNTSHYWFPIYVKIKPKVNPVMKVTIKTDASSSMNFWPLGRENLGGHIHTNKVHTFTYVKGDLSRTSINLDEQAFIPIKLERSEEIKD